MAEESCPLLALFVGAPAALALSYAEGSVIEGAGSAMLALDKKDLVSAPRIDQIHPLAIGAIPPRIFLVGEVMK